MSKIKNLLFDTASKKIFEEIVKAAEFIQNNLEILAEVKLDINPDRIKMLKEDLTEVLEILNSIYKEKTRKTAYGKLKIQELHNISVRAKRSLELFKTGPKNEPEYNRTFTDLCNFIDRTHTLKTHLENLPYPNIGITVAGFVLSPIPFFNLLSIVFGGYLAFSNDRRAQINGILMIAIVIIVVLISWFI